MAASFFVFQGVTGLRTGISALLSVKTVLMASKFCSVSRVISAPFRAFFALY